MITKTPKALKAFTDADIVNFIHDRVTFRCTIKWSRCYNVVCDTIWRLAIIMYRLLVHGVSFKCHPNPGFDMS